MKKFTVITLTFAVGCACSAGAMSASMSKNEFKAAEDRIAAGYATGETRCDSLAGNTKDICVAENEGHNRVALADLKAHAEPTAENNRDAKVAKAEADYAVANQKCDALAGNTKDVCVKEAEAVETRVKADAEAQYKVSDANKEADEKSGEASKEARMEGVEARQDASAEKRDANVALAKEKCDVLAGDAKERCLDMADATYAR